MLPLRFCNYVFKNGSISSFCLTSSPGIGLERTPKYWTSNRSNNDCLNIELSKHHILAQNRTSNITKNRTVCEHQTVRSKTTQVSKRFAWHRWIDLDVKHHTVVFDVKLRSLILPGLDTNQKPDELAQYYLLEDLTLKVRINQESNTMAMVGWP